MMNADDTLLPVKVARSQVSSLPTDTERVEGTPVNARRNKKAKQTIEQRRIKTMSATMRLKGRLVKVLGGRCLTLWAKVLAVESFRENASLPFFVCCTSSYASSPRNWKSNFRAILCTNRRRNKLSCKIVADKASLC